MIKRVTFSSINPGKHLVVLGAVHGNEPAGPESINAWIEKLESGEIELKQGRVTFVPIVNERAYAENVRFVERNLNRSLYRKKTPEAHEDLIDPILCDILDEADVLLDIHSYQSEGGPFAFLDSMTADEVSYTRSLGIKHLVTGWGDAFDDHRDMFHSMGTTEYTRFQGEFPDRPNGLSGYKYKKGIATTLECGNHLDPNNAHVASCVINNALRHLGSIDTEFMPFADDIPEQCIRMQTVFLKEKEGQFAKPWKNCDFVNEGDVIAEYEDGEKLTAPEDGYIILPKSSTDHPTGAEWFYFGVETDFPQPNQSQGFTQKSKGPGF